ncbi:MAG TPA: hypothetical protein VEQ11_13805 [Chloroflexota bacterium]|nr:hypothetical protein [Chloroflexota bacterium]
MRPDPISRLAAPAVGLIITGVLGILAGLTVAVLGTPVGVAALALSGDDRLATLVASGALIVAGLLETLISILIVFAGLQMRRAQAWGLAMSGSVLAMIPCLSPCCLLGLPIGIWSMVVLSDEEVKLAFQGGQPPPPYAPPPTPPPVPPS